MEKKNNNNRGTLGIIGCTGNQGSGVVDAVIRDGNRWRMRGLTRDVNSEQSMLLKQKGVELMEGDVLNRNDLKKFITGIDALFCLTSYWDETIRNKEFEIGKQICDVSKECGVKYFVLSSLPNVEKMSNKKYDVPHFTLKALVEEHARKIGLRFVSILPGIYYQSFLKGFPPKRENATMVFTFPLPESAYLPILDVRDIGTVIVNILKNFDQYEGKTIPLFGEHLHPTEITKIVQEVTGKPTKYKPVSMEEYETMYGRELAQMFGWMRDYGFYGPNADLNMCKKLCTFTTFRDWVRTERPFEGDFERQLGFTTTTRTTTTTTGTKQFGQQQQPGQTSTVRQG